MPVLPIDYPEPFAAVIGTMLYPNEDEAAKRRAVAAHYLAEPIRRFEAAGGALPYDDLSRIVKDGGARLDDLDQRWWGGTVMGELFKMVFALANHDPKRASWEYSARIVEKYATTAKVAGARTSIMAAKRCFLTVAHLWGAYSIRGKSFDKTSRCITTMPTISRAFLLRPKFFGSGARPGRLMLRRPNHRCPLGRGLCQKPGLRHHGSLAGHRPA